jgi:hypothetical protein
MSKMEQMKCLSDHWTCKGSQSFAALYITEHLIRSACRGAEGIFNTLLALSVADGERYRVKMRTQSVDT